MTKKDLPESRHFTLEQLADGVYACIHKTGGGAYSNAGIVDLGDRTLLVDAFDTLAAGRDLRKAAEALFARPVDTILLTHPHSDHWIGASVFDPATVLLSSETTRQVSLEWGKEILAGNEDPGEWEQWIQETEQRLQTEPDERVRAGLEISLTQTRYAMAEMAEFQPRYADQTFEGTVLFHGSRRNAQLRSFGRGHSEEDAALLLPQDKIAFIGDIGFFDSQPFFGFCDFNLYRQQMIFFRDADYQVLVPGHGPVGKNKEYLELQLQYTAVMEDLVREVVRRGGSLAEAMQIPLPGPFDQWLVGGMSRFEVNVRYLFTHLGGKLPEGG